MKILSLIIFVLMSLAGIFQTVLYRKLSKTFDSWPVVSAEITQSFFLNRLLPDGEEACEARISFNYRFRGKDYKADTPVLRGYELFPSEKYESALVAKYRKGQLYNVRVHPKIPEIAYLEVAPLSRASTILAPILSLGGMLLVGAYFYGLFDVVLEFLALTG